MTNKKRKKKENVDSKGLINSGVIYITDPSTMAASFRTHEDEVLVDPLNPFRNFEEFRLKMDEKQLYSIKFGDNQEDLVGRGIAINTGKDTGQYIVKLKKTKEGKLKQIVIELKD